VKRIMIVAFCAFCLTGCANLDLDEAIGVARGENAVMCARVEIDPTFTESRASYRRAEIPDSAKLSDLTPEQIAALMDC